MCFLLLTPMQAEPRPQGLSRPHIFPGQWKSQLRSETPGNSARGEGGAKPRLSRPSCPSLPVPVVGCSTYPCSSPAGCQCRAGCHPGPALPSGLCGLIPQTRSAGNRDRNVNAKLGRREWLLLSKERVGNCFWLSLQSCGSPGTSPASLPCLCHPFSRENCSPARTGSTERSLPGLATLGLQLVELNASHNK